MHGKNILRKIRSNKTLSMQILFVALAFAAMILMSNTFMSSTVNRNLVRNAENVLTVSETRVLSYLNNFESTFEIFEEKVRAMMLQGDTVDTLRDYVAASSAFAYIDGSEAFGVQDFYVYFEAFGDSEVLICAENNAPHDAANPRQSDWYKLAVAAGDGIVETTPKPHESGGVFFTYAKSIFDDSGRRLGVVCMDVKINDIGNDVVNTALNQGGYGMILNQDFEVMFHPNADFIGIIASDPIIPINIFYDDLVNGRDIFEQPLNSYKDEDSVAFFRKLPNGWHLGLVTPSDQYYSSMRNMAAMLSTLGIILAAILIFILMRIDAARAKSDDENKKKSMFLANMSHEIRTPINAIVGMTAIGRAAGMIERKDYCFAKIDNASKHLLGVVNDILDISKIEANKIELSPADFNFEKMLQQAVNVTNFRADEKHQKLTVSIDNAIPKILYADDQRLAQVITNLLSNAVKFTHDEGTIALKSYLLSEKNDVCTIKIEVIDNGIGITPEQQNKLFKSFQQAESSTTRKYGGTGLGLAISKSIVEMMGGEISIKSNFGKGTTAAFTVNVRRGEDTHCELCQYGINWTNVRILAVDDDPDVLMYFEETVANLGATCEVASNADEALRLIDEKGSYDIYFVDLRMPDVDGISLTKALRAKENNPEHSVVIMISSADLSAVEAEARKAGVNKFVLKPLFPSSIGDVISECIGIVNDKADDPPVDLDGIFDGFRILFAEDIEINREIVISLLEPTRLQIDCAENGVEAVKMFSENPERYDMIFMDIQMPEMDGYEATRHIRALNCPRATTMPIVAMTANVFKEDIDACLTAGMNGHLGKPIDLDDIVKALRHYLPLDRQPANNG